MKLALKLVSFLVLGILLLLVAETYLSISIDNKLFESDLREDAFKMGRILRNLTRDAWNTHGQDRALRLLKDATEGKKRLVRTRWVWQEDLSEQAEQRGMGKELLARLRNGEQIAFTGYNRDDTATIFTYTPLMIQGTRAGAIELAKPLDGLADFRNLSIKSTVTLAVLMLLGSAVAVVYLGVTMIGRPLNRLIEKTRRIGNSDLADPLELRGYGEFSELARALNEMCERLSASHRRLESEMQARIDALEQLRHADRLQTVGRLAAGLAHELGTPLNVVSGRAEMIRSGGLSQAQAGECARIIKGQSERMTNLIRQLLDFARHRPAQRSPTDITALTHQTIDLLEPMAKKNRINFRLRFEQENNIVRADANRIQQVLTNLLVNAIQATQNGGAITITLSRKRRQAPNTFKCSPAEFLGVAIADEGEGIDDDDRHHLFEPFFTTKDVGEGTGLGLSIAYGIVREHGGWIDVSSTPGLGSCFTMFLPREGSHDKANLDC